MGGARRDRVRAEARRLLASGVAGTVFPGAACCVSFRDEDSREILWAEACAGFLLPPAGAATRPPTRENTIYDVASLTKPLVAAIALRLIARGTLSLDLRVDALIPDLRGTPAGPATLEQLLSHRAGLAAWGGFYLDVPHEPGTNAARRWIISEAGRRQGDAVVGKMLYSDLGYILAGEMISRASSRDLDVLLTTEIVRPLGIPEDQMVYASALSPEKRADLVRRCAATERDDWRGKLLRGEVHDENCFALGGISGHAGVFATARAIASFGRAYMESYLGASDFIPRELCVAALAPRSEGSYRMGWDAKAAENSAAGRRLSSRTFGHLGFTGTSIYCDPERDMVVVLLTNRVCPSRANEKIRGFRPAFHDGVTAVVDSFAKPRVA